MKGLTYDNVLRAAGLLGVAHETLIGKADRPTLLLIFGAMAGLPSFLGRDAQDKKGHE